MDLNYVLFRKGILFLFLLPIKIISLSLLTEPALVLIINKQTFLQARQILEKEAESRTCIISNGFLVLFSSGGAASTSATINSLTLNLNGGNTISPARSTNSITNSTGGRNKDDLGGGDDETGANALAGAAAGV